MVRGQAVYLFPRELIEEQSSSQSEIFKFAQNSSFFHILTWKNAEMAKPRRMERERERERERETEIHFILKAKVETASMRRNGRWIKY